MGKRIYVHNKKRNTVYIYKDQENIKLIEGESIISEEEYKLLTPNVQTIKIKPLNTKPIKNTFDIIYIYNKRTHTIYTGKTDQEIIYIKDEEIILSETESFTALLADPTLKIRKI